MSKYSKAAAAEIVALVNASPRTPPPEQIEAIVGKAIAHADGGGHHEACPFEATWDALIQQWEAAWQRVADAEDAADAKGKLTPDVEAAEEAAQVIARQIDALAKRIIACPEPTLDYARLMVRVTYYLTWGDDWHGIHPDILRAGGPSIGDSLADNAVAALMAATWAIKRTEVCHG
jgi:hypothetical protein